ncbi:hypothetical protein FJK98_31060 [Micromonospora sp. HM134]|uniref:hypothetical protein n=1 Tax=Micromonospora sp. HM134 TaxID=2583243 RepID=UPI0011984C66|nr:hypothetical protein [Micromonospora sp. HM134]QDY11043.1 hypothetical protein FJK98_31060 [Micromonospora sp. HM134]
MGKNLLGKAINAVTRCTYCKGNGRVPQYHQGAEVIKNGRTVAYTECTPMKTCPTCGGSGRSR